jgi:ribose transport system ATP-binding protein
MRPKVLLLHEPTQGVDIGAKAAIYRLIGEAARAGTAVLLVSTDADELAEIADRVLVLKDGVAVGELCEERLTARNISAGVLGETSELQTMTPRASKRRSADDQQRKEQP